MTEIKLTPEEMAKDMVNDFYQPLGEIPNSCNSSQLWGHAKKLAHIACVKILATIHIYEGNLNPNWAYWDAVKVYIQKQ